MITIRGFYYLNTGSLVAFQYLKGMQLLAIQDTD